MGLSPEVTEGYIAGIRSSTAPEVRLIELSGGEQAFFSYLCPLPRFSAKPQAFVLMMIPLSVVKPLVESQLANSSGEVAVFSSGGTEIYRLGTLDAPLPLSPASPAGTKGAERLTYQGEEYVIQRQTSQVNGWTYVSALRLSDLISGLASRQLLLILLLLAMMFLAITVLLAVVLIQYKPIRNLAVAVTDQPQSDDESQLIDENVLLSSTFAALKDDSAQKQHFETAFREAETASRAKSAFLSNMSHDIRTPMNAIVGLTALAERYADDPDYVRESLQKVRIASRYLLDIINNVLDMSRIESGRFTLSEETVELSTLVYGLMTILDQSAEGKGQTLVVEAEDVEHESVRGDGVRLTQVLVNILSNAVKFTPEGGTISLRVRELPGGDAACGNYEFTCSDTGIGMPKEFVGQVFDAFSRATDSTVSKIEGTGLGMAIAKSLVEMMGGTIACESEVGKGTTFMVRVPLKWAENGETPPAGDVGSVLLVGEAEPCARLAKVFSQTGAAVEQTASPDEAAERAVRAAAGGTPYRVILIHPGGEDGLAAAKRLSCEKLPGTLRALAVRDTAKGNQAALRRAGIDAFVQLPLFKSAALRLLRGETEDLSAHAPDAAADLAGRRVLLVEDNALNREIACRIIGEARAEVVEAADGRQAVDAFKAHAPGYFDVILMDIQMPVMDGYGAAAAIRALPRPDAARIPIYALTANTFADDVRRVRAAGMDGYVGKPYMPSDLYRALSQALKGRA